MNNIKKSRVHPIVIIDAIIGFLRHSWFVLVYIIFKEDNSKWLLAVIVGVLAVYSIIGLLRYFTTTYEVKDGVIIYREGIFNKKIKNINFENVQSLDTSSNILYQVFSLVSLDINLVGDSLRIKPLKKEIALRIVNNLNEIRKNEQGAIELEENITEDRLEDKSKKIILEKDAVKILTLSIKDLAFYGLLKVRILAAVGLLLAFYNNIRDAISYIFDDESIADKYLEQGVQNASENVRVLLSVVLGFIVLIVVGSVLFTIVKFYNFTLLKKDNNFLCKYGLLNQKSLVIDVERLQSIKIKEPLRYRFFGLAKLSVETLTKKVSDDLTDEKTTIDLMPLAKKAYIERFIEDNLGLDLEYYNSLDAEKIPPRARFVLYRWSFINNIYLPALIFAILYIAKPPIISDYKIIVTVVIYILLVIYSLIVKTYRLKTNALSYDKFNFKYVYTSGLEKITEFIKVKKVGTINSTTQYFLNRLNLIHLTINSIGNNSDIHLNYYDKNYRHKLEKDFLEKENSDGKNI